MNSQTLVSESKLDQITRELKKPKVAKLFKMAERYGIVKRGFCAIDYLRDAVKNLGWESTAITGIKGSAKSNLLWQRGYALYQDWNTVNQHVVTEGYQLLDLLDTEDRVPWIGVDDIATIFPSNLYHTDRKLYTETGKNWETLRTKMNCFDFTATRKNKIAKFILEDITGDIICYNRIGEIKSHYDYQRWMWIRNLKDPTDMIAKIVRIEDIAFPLTPEGFQVDKSMREQQFIIAGQTVKGEQFYKDHACLTGMPRTEFKRYWERRLALANRAYRDFKQIFETQQKPEPEVRNPISESDASKAGRALVNCRKDRRGTST